MSIYVYWFLPIYYMFTAQESDIADNAIAIARQMINEFKYAEGCIGVVRYACLERLPNRKINSGNDISPQGPVFYGTPTLIVAGEAFQGIPYNLIIKMTKLASLHA